MQEEIKHPDGTTPVVVVRTREDARDIIADLKTTTTDTIAAAGEGFYLANLNDELVFCAAIGGEMMSRVKAVEVPFTERAADSDVEMG
jgi:hypothetical protein